MSSQAMLYSRRFVLNLHPAFLILVWCFLFTGGAPAQTSAPTPSHDARSEVTNEDRQLNEARRQNEEAKAEYYRTQTKKLNEPVAAKGFFDNAAILGAVTAALVALFSLIVNLRTGFRARKDTEFYEALKRFGDKDSPTVRASAAAMIAQISDTSFYRFPRRRPDKKWRDLTGKLWPRVLEWVKKRTRDYPYFDTALDQLVTGLSIEQHATVVASITDAITRLIPKNRDRAATQLHIANQRLQAEVVEQLARLTAFIADDEKWPEVQYWKESETVWDVVCPSIGYSREALEDIPGRFKTQFDVARNDAALTLAIKADEKSKSDMLETIRTRLRDIGWRLRQNVSLLVQPFVKERVYSFLDLRGVFLAGAEFPRGSNLSGIFLDLAVLCDAKLTYSDLSLSSLVMSHLEGADLLNADLKESYLGGARIDDRTVFLGSNWWKADFSSTIDQLNLGFTDSRRLLDDLARRGSLSPEQLREAHPSVRKHFESHA